MAEQSPDSLREAAPAYEDLEAKRARAGVAAALFGADEESERLAVGRYEIDSRLGSGGMGVVYRAHDPDLDRPVAVKLLHADSSADDKARARMLREARALAKLSHPNVITVYDVGTEDGQVFVAMELVAGRDLRRWLDERRAADWREVLALFIAAGRGLEAAHEVALVHRDFKPENVLVGEDGRVRVLDFGLARMHRPVDAPTAEDEGPGEGGADVVKTDDVGADIGHMQTAAFSGGLTETGALLGTPLYMAPELYAGQPADVRSDQFAFCASLYEGLYRQLPFGSRNLSAHVEAVRGGRVVAPPEDSAIPGQLWRAIARGLDPDPESRWRDMATLLAALERVASEPAPTELPTSGGGWRWLVIGATVVAAVVGLIGLELGWFGAGEPEVPGGSQLAGRVADQAPRAEPDSSAPDSTEPASSDGPEAEPEAVAGTETGAGEGAAGVAADTAGETEGTDGAGDEPGDTSEDGSGEPQSSNLHGWCHLHEDRYTLLARPKAHRGSFEHEGTCYTCRVERRASRTRNFSPRDCAGYSLCGKDSPEACQ